MEHHALQPFAFLRLAQLMLAKARSSSSLSEERRFHALFGVSPFLCSILWKRLGEKKSNSNEPVHLLWSLMFLKVYASEDVLSALAGVTRKTYRKWVWDYVEKLSFLNEVSDVRRNLICELTLPHAQVRWEDRLLSGIPVDDGNNIVHITVDGTDLQIREPQLFNPHWYSHKFKGAALRYEIGVSVVSGCIVWVHGPFSAGLYNDQSIFNLKMLNSLSSREKVLGDKGYGGPKIVHRLSTNGTVDTLSKNLRAHHEQINGRIKSFQSMSQKWRHSIKKHGFCFFAIANIVQLKIATNFSRNAT